MSDSFLPVYERNQYLKPQLNLAISTAKRMWLLNLCAFAVIFQSSLSDSFSSMFIALNAVAAALITEFICLHKNGRTAALKDGSAVASALILSLLLPNTISPVYAVIGSVFAIAIIKHSFGGLGSNCINPAAGAWLFIRFSWPYVFSAVQEVNEINTVNLNENILQFLNNNIFSLFSSYLPESYLSFFSSPHSGIIADRGILALLLGTVLMLAFKASRIWIPALYLTVFCLLHRYAGALPLGADPWEGEIFVTLFSGGSFAAAFFLSTECGAAAKSSLGIFFLVVLGAFLAFIFRAYGGEFFGAIYGILFVNALTPLIRILEDRLLYAKWEKMRNSLSLQKPGREEFSHD